MQDAQALRESTFDVESDVYRRQILTTKVYPRAVKLTLSTVTIVV